MSRSSVFLRLTRIRHIAQECRRLGIPSREGVELAGAAKSGRPNRRDFLNSCGLAAAGAAALSSPMRPLLALQSAPPNVDVGIVGAGLAGLACAYELRRRGVTASLYEASDRVGGRCWSLNDFFSGQVVERGGELIDNLHKTLLGYAREFGLAVEDVNKGPGDPFYFVGGRHVAEAEVVDEFRDLVPLMREDLRSLSNQPTADAHTPADVALDFTSLREYLATRDAGSVIRAVLDVAYTIEYGLDTDRQSCLNLLFFIHADRRSRFQPFGVFSDERYHVIAGNQRIPEGLAARLPGQILNGHELLRVRRTAAGRVELTVAVARKTITRTHDAVVLAIPFSTLRRVDLDASLELPAWKRLAINTLPYGTNTKLMLGFGGRPWLAEGNNGDTYSDLPNHQNTWETNPANASAARGVITDYSGGERGASLNPRKLQQEATAFLNDFDTVVPGVFAAASRDQKGRFVAHLEHWSSNPLALGSYTCNQPGYFTTIAGNEAKPVGNLFFAGEHTDSFYEWQGFMEGAANSGIRASAEILGAVKTGQL